MGQKNTRIDDSAFESGIVSTNDTLIYNFDSNKNNLEDLTKNEKNSNNIRFKSFSFIQKDHKLKSVVKKNSSEVFSSQLTNNSKKTLRPKHVQIEEEVTNIKPSVRDGFVNNFYAFLNKKNTQSNRSVLYYVPERKNSLENEEKKKIFQVSKRSKSISEINDSIVSEIDSNLIQDFTDLELKTIKLTYQFIQENLSNVGVIAFMKY